MRPSRTAITSNPTASPARPGRAPSHASAARRSRRCFSALTISSGSPNLALFFSLTSTKRRARPRLTIRSSSWPPAHTFSPRIFQPRSRYHHTAFRSAAWPEPLLGNSLLALVAERLEAEPMHRGRAAGAHDRGVAGRDVADVPCEAVRGIERVEAAHQAVARHLRHDRGRGNRRAFLVAVDDGSVLRRSRAEPEAVDEAGLGRRSQRLEHRPQAGEVRAVQAVAVDVAGRDHAHGDALRARDDGAEEVLAPLRRALLRVVEKAERPDAVVAQRAVVEENARHDERAGERAAPRLVGAGDEARAEASIEAQEPLAGPFHLPARISASPGDEDRPAANSGKLLLGWSRLGLFGSLGLGLGFGLRSLFLRGRLVHRLRLGLCCLGSLCGLSLGRLGLLRVDDLDGRLVLHAFGVRERRLDRHRQLRPGSVAPLTHPRPLADTAAKVVELRAVDVADRGDLDLLDLRRVERERPLDADAERLLAHRERLARAGSLPLEHDPLEDLHPPASALDDLEVHAHGVARLEARHVAQLSALEVLDDVAHGKRAGRPTAKGSERRSYLKLMRSGGQ